MNVVIWALAVTLLGFPQLQGASPLGDDPSRFDQLLEAAYLHRDVIFVEAAVADDLAYVLGPENDANVWNKQQFVTAVRFYDGRERNVGSVKVETAENGAVLTSGHIQVKTLRAEGPEYQVYFTRVYKRRSAGWQLTSHRVVWQVNRP